MSNVKTVNVKGVVPFTFGESNDAARWLAQMNMPHIGLRIKYNSAPAVQNSNGGQTAMYAFYIDGSEALPIEAIQEMLQSFVNAGARIDKVEVYDLDNRESIQLDIPEPGPVQFILELVVQPGDAGNAFETEHGSILDMVAQMQLKDYLEAHLIVYTDEDGRLEDHIARAGEDATVSLATAGLRKR